MEQSAALKEAKQMVELDLIQKRIYELENANTPSTEDHIEIQQQNVLSLRIINSIPFQMI